MTPDVWALVLFSAVCHALWNFAARRVSGDIVVFWLALVAGCLLLLPVGLVQVARGLHQGIGGLGVACMLATGLLHAAYFTLLARAYKVGEISVVYPIARGSGIGLTAFLAWLLLGEKVSPLGAAGILLVFLGILAMGAPALLLRRKVGGLGMALAVGASIVGYSLVDKVGVGQVDPVLYITAMWLVGTSLMTPGVLRQHRAHLGQVARRHRGTIALIGFGSILTYLMILYAFTRGPVSYIVAARESSVVIGALLGVLFLREPLYPGKVLAVLCIAAGMILIRLG